MFFDFMVPAQNSSGHSRSKFGLRNNYYEFNAKGYTRDREKCANQN